MTSATPKPRAGEHTKGPWRIEVHPDEKGVGLYADAWGFLGFLDSGAPDQANARRIVACVNALEGVSLEAIENGGRSGSVMQALGIERDRAKVLLEATQRQYIEAKAERDSLRERERELVEALEDLCSIVQYAVNRLDTDQAQPQVSGDLAVQLAGARAALAKASP